MKYENTFKAIDQILWKEQGCGSELDYLEQKSWMLFLKYLDDLETEREDEAELVGKSYKRLVSGFYRWSQWATPKKRDPQTGKMVLDTVNAMSGDDLVEFVDQKLFPYLKDFQNTAASTDTLERLSVRCAAGREIEYIPARHKKSSKAKTLLLQQKEEDNEIRYLHSTSGCGDRTRTCDLRVKEDLCRRKMSLKNRETVDLTAFGAIQIFV